MSDSKAAVVLAAGQGKRMKSDLPKVLHPVHGRPMISILLDTLQSLNFTHTVVIIGYKGEKVQEALSSYPVEFVWQKEQLGTGHAVKMAAEVLKDFSGTTIVTAGDAPFLSSNTIGDLLAKHRQSESAATCLSAIFEDSTGYGRIIRDGQSDRLTGIVEEKDASSDIKAIKEINSGTFCFENKLLFETLDEIRNENAQQEYYLTDAVKILNSKGLTVSVLVAPNPDEVLGVNSEEQLKELESKFPL